MEEKYINELINLSKKSLKKSEVPIAALIIDENGKIISKAYNTRNIKQQTINHAEILAITKANKKLKRSKRLHHCRALDRYRGHRYFGGDYHRSVHWRTESSTNYQIKI